MLLLLNFENNEIIVFTEPTSRFNNRITELPAALPVRNDVDESAM